MLNFDGKIVLITGGNSGIGTTAVDLFVKQGAKVISTDITFPAGDPQEINFGKNPVEAQLDVMDSKESKPLKRFGEAIEVANTILFLASDEASYITGECVDVNGGMLMD